MSQPPTTAPSTPPPCKLPSDFVPTCAAATWNAHHLKSTYGDAAQTLYTNTLNKINTCQSNIPGFANAHTFSSQNGAKCFQSCSSSSLRDANQEFCKKCDDANAIVKKATETCVKPEDRAALGMSTDYKYNMSMFPNSKEDCSTVATKNSCMYNNMLYPMFQKWGSFSCECNESVESCARKQYCATGRLDEESKKWCEYP